MPMRSQENGGGACSVCTHVLVNARSLEHKSANARRERGLARAGALIRACTNGRDGGAGKWTFEGPGLTYDEGVVVVAVGAGAAWVRCSARARAQRWIVLRSIPSAAAVWTLFPPKRRSA